MGMTLQTINNHPSKPPSNPSLRGSPIHSHLEALGLGSVGGFQDHQRSEAQDRRDAHGLQALVGIAAIAVPVEVQRSRCVSSELASKPLQLFQSGSV